MCLASSMFADVGCSTRRRERNVSMHRQQMERLQPAHRTFSQPPSFSIPTRHSGHILRVPGFSRIHSRSCSSSSVSIRRFTAQERPGCQGVAHRVHVALSADRAVEFSLRVSRPGPRHSLLRPFTSGTSSYTPGHPWVVQGRT